MNAEAWEAAFALMSDHGQGVACGIVADGMEKADEMPVYRAWEAIADCLNSVAFNGVTEH
ncbi:hypothetical protein [Sphingomonas sp. R86521]|uniref:hypothetical protein n=1 Tax=Sphingomonas sp. R86521 TaxID=3093860 RepID=UPI0036D3D9DC